MFFNISQSRKKGAVLFFFGRSSCQILHIAVLGRCDENTYPPTGTNFALHPSQAAFMTHAVCTPFNGIQETQSNSRPHGVRKNHPFHQMGTRNMCLKENHKKSPTRLGYLQSEKSVQLYEFTLKTKSHLLG